jgi:DNA-binding protein HU-beta
MAKAAPKKVAKGPAAKPAKKPVAKAATKAVAKSAGKAAVKASAKPAAKAAPKAKASKAGGLKVTKPDIVMAIAEQAGMSKAAAGAIVDGVFEMITNTLKKGGDVKIMGFGNFRVAKRKARKGRDPRTGEAVNIKASKAPRFSAGKALKEAVN